ncbi:MAG: hypothetical protein D6705_05400 [Deltaproteobacteria bacterium]|nr:MAG: hypothetical protein D6705_05400 [Deltaproteobacteria bacterium]
MRPSIAKLLVFLGIFGSASACTTDLPAPDNYASASASATATTGVPGDLEVDCGMPALGAVDANYSHTVSAQGGMAPYSFSATGLEPLTIDTLTGTITGVPDAEGTITGEVTVTDALGATASTTCTITVRPRLDAEIPDSKLMPCAVDGETLFDFVVPDTGDGSPITCATPGGEGNGKMPAGLSVNPDTCAVEGSITEDRYGTWVWIVEGQQNGVSVYVPYCATNDTQAPGAYDITVFHGGDLQTNKALVPARGTFQPGAPLSFGDPNASDPRFEIVDPANCGNPCFFGFAFFINASPFDGTTFSLNPRGLLQDMNMQNIGMFHHMSVDGPAVTAPFENRPWVLNVSLDYCLSNVDQATCMGADAVKANGNGNLEFAVVMFPQ